VCGVGAELGTVEAGKLADLIVVGANPLEDITNVRRLQLVLKRAE
jgi:imidazolonepropionase-like amidohydrolase